MDRCEGLFNVGIVYKILLSCVVNLKTFIVRLVPAAKEETGHFLFRGYEAKILSRAETNQRREDSLAKSSMHQTHRARRRKALFLQRCTSAPLSVVNILRLYMLCLPHETWLHVYYCLFMLP